MNIIKTVCMAVSALTLAACTNDKLDDSLENGPVSMSFIADVSAMNSRANAAGTAFTEGDKVGIVPIKNGAVESAQYNLCYTLGADGVFSSENPYWFRDRNTVTFNAYYPYTAEKIDDKPGMIGNEIPIHIEAKYQVAEDEAVARNWRKNDYLFASKTATVNSATVSFTGEHAFRHVMSKVTFKFKAGDGVDNLAGLSDYKLLNLYIIGFFNVVTGNVTAVAKGVLSMSVTGSAETEITVDPLILIPQTLPQPGMYLYVTYNGVNYRADMSSLTLDPGKHYMFTVTIDNTGLNVSEAAIVDWETESGSISATM